MSLNDAFEIVPDNVHRDNGNNSGSFLAAKKQNNNYNSDKPKCSNCDHI
jgi:hypothetical protein